MARFKPDLKSPLSSSKHTMKSHHHHHHHHRVHLLVVAYCSAVYSPPPRGFIDQASPLPEEMLFINAFLDNELPLTLRR